MLDANVLISALNHDSGTSEIQYRAAREKLSSLLQDDSIGVVLTPLVRHEVMRGLPRWDLSKIASVKNTLDGFITISITDEISGVATTVYQILKEQDEIRGGSERNSYKLAFDIMHVATAHVYNLELISTDSDIEKGSSEKSVGDFGLWEIAQ